MGVRVAALECSRAEIDALVGVLDYYVPDLHVEVRRTRDGELRQRLREQESLLLRLRARLVALRDQWRDEIDRAHD